MSNDPYSSPQDNPYATPASFQTAETQRRRAIWTKELKSARTVLIIVGVIQLLFGVYFLSQTRSNYDEAVKAEVAKQGPLYVVDKELADKNFEKQKTTLCAMYSLPVAYGIFLFVMAALVFKYPVGVTLASLISFVLIHAADVIVDPAQLAKGIIMKIVFIAVLWKAFQSARNAKAAMA